MACTPVLLALLASCALATSESSRSHANPIRKVVGMLQDMQKSVEEEGEKEKELFEKFMCYCNNGAGALDVAIQTGTAKVEELSSKIESDTALKAQLEQEVTQHKTDREEAEKAIKENTALREKEASEFAATSGEMKANVEAMGGALSALKKGLSAAMLQTGVGRTLQNIVSQSPVVSASQREMFQSFLENGATADDSGSSDQIIGIVEQMKETMEGDLKESTESEQEAQAGFTTLMASKNTEISAAGKAIESKTARTGEMAVEVVQGKADLEDTSEAVEEDTKFKANLAKQCATKQKEWDERSKLRAQEIEALSDTIKLLNDDDALDLFKKTLPSASALIQTSATTTSQARRARSLIQDALNADRTHSPLLRMILISLNSKSHGGFDKVLKMIDDMVTLLAKEQAADDTKKDFCIAELDKVEDEKKELERTISDLEAEIEELSDNIATTEGEIAALKQGLLDLDKSVTEATEQRKDEHTEYTDTSAANQAALELIEMAKNRMNKFYNPSQYKAPPTTTESSSPYGFVQVSLRTGRADPGPAPETFGEYKKTDSGGVTGMMSQMSKDVEMDMAEAKHDEESAQEDYEESMKDAATKRADDSKLIVTKEGERSDMASKLEDLKSNKVTKEQQHGDASAALNDLHKTCDFLLDNFDSRKTARATESDGLKQSKSVLQGASMGFLQQHA